MDKRGAAQATLAAAYPSLVRRLALLLYDVDAAAALAPRVFVRALRERADEEGLARIGLRVAVNRLRRQGKLRAWPGARAEVHPGQAAWVPAQHVALWLALGELQPMLRASLVLCVADRLSADDAARRLGTSRGAVSSWTALARSRLGEMPLDAAESDPATDRPLREALLALEASVPAPAEAPDAHGLRRRILVSRALRLGAVGALALVIAVAGTWARGGFAPTRTGPGTQRGEPAFTHLEWTTLPFVSGDAAIGWVGVVNDHLLATGRVGKQPAAWVSFDARTWTRAAIADAESSMARNPWDAGIGPAALRDGELLAPGQITTIGRGQFQTALWRSRDGGRTWSLAEDSIPIAASGIVATSTGFFATGGAGGWSYSPDEPGAWSSDGVTWAPAVGLPHGAWLLVAATTTTTVAIDGGSGTPAIWRSTDGGQSWEAVDVQDVVAGSLMALVADESGYVAVGATSDEPSGAAVWRSADGAAWTAEALGEADTAARVVAAGPTGLAVAGTAALGSGSVADVAWFVPADAARAKAWPLAGLLGGARVGPMAWFGDRVVAIASCNPWDACSGALVLLGDPATGPLPTVPPRTPYPSATPSPPVVPGPTASEAEPISWQRVTLDGAKGGQLAHIARISGRWIISGQLGGAAAAWYSDDGMTWRAASVAQGDEGTTATMGPVAGMDDTLIAVGWGATAGSGAADTAVAWISRDHGESWQATQPPAGATILRSIAAGPAGFVAISGWAGCCTLGTPPAVVVSRDGSTWRVLDSAPFGQAALNDVASDGQRYAIVGERGDSSSGDAANAVPAAWWSADGIAWTEADIEGVGRPGGLIDVTADGDGFHAVALQYEPGTSAAGITMWETSDASAWISDDAGTGWWTPWIDRLSEPAGLAIAYGGQRLIVTGEERQAPGIVWYADASGAWRAETDNLGGAVNPEGAAVGGSTIVIISNCPSYATACDGPSLVVGHDPGGT